jgi:hypothetical protein
VSETLPAFGALKVGEPVVLGGYGYEVIDIERARCIAGEGELPFRVAAGYDAERESGSAGKAASMGPCFT